MSCEIPRLKTKKGRDLLHEPFEGKNLAELPGVGLETAKRFIDAGIETPQKLYNEFLKLKDSPPAFNQFMKEKAKMQKPNLFTLFNFFSWRYYIFSEEPITNSEKSSKRFNETKVANPVPIKKSKPSVQFEERKPNVEVNDEESEELVEDPPIQKQEKYEPLKEFFVSKLHVVKSLPFHLQMKVKKNISKIIFEAENEALEIEVEPNL